MTGTFVFDTAPISPEESDRLTMDMVRVLSQTYEPGKDRVVTPENVYQPAVTIGQEAMVGLAMKFLLPGSRVAGLENLDDCLERMARGEKILFLPEHRGNLDTSTFFALLRLEDPKYEAILQKLIYIAGRKLNESSERIKMFTEKYSRLVIVPRRDFPRPHPGESRAEASERTAFEQNARRINRAAFRALLRLREQGYLFVLFPLGGRVKPDADNIPVRETATYLRAFDTFFPVSMDGNVLPPLPRMEDERPVQGKVVFTVGPAVNTLAFLEQQRAAYEAEGHEAHPSSPDFEQFVANNIMVQLAALRCGKPAFGAAS